MFVVGQRVSVPDPVNRRGNRIEVTLTRVNDVMVHYRTDDGRDGWEYALWTFTVGPTEERIAALVEKAFAAGFAAHGEYIGGGDARPTIRISWTGATPRASACASIREPCRCMAGSGRCSHDGSRGRRHHRVSARDRTARYALVRDVTWTLPSTPRADTKSPCGDGASDVAAPGRSRRPTGNRNERPNRARLPERCPSRSGLRARPRSRPHARSLMYAIYFLRRPLVAAALATVALFIIPAACVIVNDPRPPVSIPHTPPRPDGCVMFCPDLEGR